MALQKTQDYISQLRRIDQFQQGVELLLHGFLTPQLVSRSTLRSNLIEIRSHLQAFYPNFVLIFDKAASFYTMHDFLFGRHSSHLLIQIQIPLTVFRDDFTVYKVDSFPIPVTGRISHSTSVLDLPQYFVTDRQLSFYFVMERDDSSRHPQLLYLLDNKIPLNSFETGSTCISALYRNDLSQIRQLCSFSIKEHALVPSVNFLSNGTVIFTNLSSLTLKCSDGMHVLEGCVQCVRRVPCNCEVQVYMTNSSLPTRYWPSKLFGCPIAANVTETHYIVNLASLQSFVLDTSLGTLSGNSLLDAPLPVDLPAFRHYKHQFHDFISRDDKQSHDLRKFAERVKNDSTVFHEVSDVLLEHMSGIVDSYKNDMLFSFRYNEIGWWVTWTSVICSYLSFVLVLFLSYKFKLSGSALAMVRSANAQTLPAALSYAGQKQVFSDVTATLNNTILESGVEYWHLHIGTIILIVVLVSILIIGYRYYVVRRKNLVHVVLEIGDCFSATKVRCMSLDSTIYAYTFKATSFVESLAITKCPPKLLISWNSFEIFHIITETPLEFPKSVLISFWQMYQLSRKINSRKFYVIALLEYQGQFKLIDFNEQATVRDSHAITVTTNSANEMAEEQTVSIPLSTLKLYPSLARLVDDNI